MRRLVVYLGLYVFLAIAWFAVGWLAESHQRDLGAVLSKNGVVTTAGVTRSEPQDHNTICFIYSVNGVTYEGCDSAHFGKDATQLPEGSSTQITYRATNPSVYCACPAESLVRNAREAPIVGALWMGTGVWAMIVVGGRKSLVPWLVARLTR